MTISVLIATYNRAPLLEECLAHLGRQHFDPGDEVIVVDNGSTDATSSVVRQSAARSAMPIRYLHEPAPGKSRAIARALEIAAGDILAFTDDDVNVADDWLVTIREAMSEPRVTLVGGPVTPRWEREPPGWLRPSGEGYGRLAAPLALLDYGPRPSDLGARTLLGANFAIRGDVIRQLGGFAAHLGKLRDTLLSGEDHELCRRVQAAGFHARYRPEIRVEHWVPAHRARPRYVLSWFFWFGITSAMLDEHDASRARTVAGLPVYLIRRFLKALVGAPAAWLTGRAPTALERAADGAFAAGYAAKCWRLVARERSPGSCHAGTLA
jgi:glycosyltransferase involved in cell wall biosynthesis